MCSAWSCGLRSGGCIGSSVGRSARSTSALVCTAGPFAGLWASEKPLRSRRAPSASKLDPFRDWVCRQLQAARIARAPLCGYTGPEFQRTLLARSGHSTRNNSSCSEQSRHPETERSAGACFPSPTSISSPSTDGLLCARKAGRRARHPSPGRCLGARGRAACGAALVLSRQSKRRVAPSRDHARLPVCRRGWRRDRRFCFDWPAGPEQKGRSLAASAAGGVHVRG